MTFGFVKAEKASFPIDRMCRFLVTIALGPMADNGLILDLFLRRVVSWATRDRLKSALAIEALRRALVARNPGA